MHQDNINNGVLSTIANTTTKLNANNLTNITIPFQNNVDKGTEIFVACFLCIIIVVTIIGNSIALTAFRISHQLRSVAYIFIINLCISDLMVAILSMPFWILYIITSWPNNSSGVIYTLWICLDIFCGTWSIMSLAMISIERYMCISYPLHYEKMVSEIRARKMVAFVLVYSTLSAFLGYAQTIIAETKFSISIFATAYVIPVLIKTYTYGNIYREAKKHQLSMRQEERERIRLTKSYVDTDLPSTIVQSYPCKKTTGESKLNNDVKSSKSSKNTADEETKLKCSAEGNSSQEDASVEEEQWSFASKKRHYRKQISEDRKRCHLKRPRAETDRTKRKTLCCFTCQKGSKNCVKKVKGNQTKNICTKNNSIEENGDIEKANIERIISADSESNEDVSKLRNEGIEDWKEYLDNLEKKIDKKFKQDTVQEQMYGMKKSKIERTTSLPINVEKSKHQTDQMVIRDDLSRHITNKNEPIKEKLSETSWKMIYTSRTSRFFKSNGLNEIKRRSFLKLRRVQKELKAAKVIGTIIGTFLILWTPFMFVVLLSSIAVPISMQTIIAAKCLHYSNSAINPVLYVILNKSLRRAMRKVLVRIGICKKRNRSDYY